MLNQVKMTFASRSVNESFSRAALAAFLAQADPTVPQLADIKTAVSEAVTNCIVHAYPDTVGPITMTAVLYEGGNVRITISDKGVGIPDVAKAMEPMYTTGNPAERAGLGFAVMQSFMDRVHVSSAPGREHALPCAVTWIPGEFWRVRSYIGQNQPVQQSGIC